MIGNTLFIAFMVAVVTALLAIQLEVKKIAKQLQVERRVGYDRENSGSNDSESMAEPAPDAGLSRNHQQLSQHPVEEQASGGSDE